MSRKKSEEEEGEVVESSEEEESDEESQGEESQGEEGAPEQKISHERVPAHVTVEREFSELCSKFHRTLHKRGAQGNATSAYNQWSETTHKLYAKSRLPTAEQIAPFVKRDAAFMKIYKELYHRHIYNEPELEPTISDRFNSFLAFTDIFDDLLSFQIDQWDLDLNTIWLADVMDQFISSFREFHEFRWNVHRYNLSAADLKQLSKGKHVWSVKTVIRYLQNLSKKGGVDMTKLWTEGHTPQTTSRDKSTAEVFRYLSHFSLVALSRVHCILGDYISTVRVLDPIDLTKWQFTPQNAVNAKLSLYHHACFALLMLRRYTDCVKYLMTIFQRGSQIFKDRGIYRDSSIASLEPVMDKMWCLLAVANRVCPQVLESDIKTKVDEYNKIQLQDLFDMCCPGFIDPTLPPSTSSKSKLSVEVINRPVHDAQKKVFLAEVAQRNLLPQVYEDLKMCTNVDVAKITRLIERQKQGKGQSKSTSDTAQAAIDEEQTYSLLMKLKHKTRNLRWQAGGSTSGGKWMSTSEVDFEVDLDVITVKEPSTQGFSAQHFIRGIHVQQQHRFDLRHS